MKKLFLSTILSIVIATSLFAADVTTTNARAESEFALQFVKAKNVQWTSTKNYVKASFILDNKNMEAYYDFQGNVIGTSHAITIDDLPTNAKRSFAKKYADYTVKEAIQFNGSDEISYYISAENDQHNVVLHVTEQGLVSIFKSTNK